ncbi:hypothetical protein VOLCADRAFT_107105 [Volvox carteri f. nagariensis]|uniref:Uncharacterized protein n=1 Tax=Volvox carteri f. nagariensis TaxID=3068 RepID=D8UBZ6_VOLCA|nr:uncharacterized protein VOLCADRAFT_107105 [Volvox carteri f. nagariensis]EFJ42757.1 hypothetical protein VOLCADRAFT_107105 [Volvox carteri f. nagariensis]|eukprot:XP_002956218.1 hypothetical protein VOLCADRAFT_107105 [Volvox carteri f. nagariensis]
MSDQVLEQISEAQVDDETEIQPGTVFLLKWLAETWGEAGKGVVQQFLVFYALMLVGFGFLYLMMRSTAQPCWISYRNTWMRTSLVTFSSRKTRFRVATDWAYYCEGTVEYWTSSK